VGTVLISQLSAGGIYKFVFPNSFFFNDRELFTKKYAGD
jgi:hypothetical protein